MYQFLIPVEDCRPPVEDSCSSTEGGSCDLSSVENTIIIQSDNTIQVNFYKIPHLKKTKNQYIVVL